MKTVNKVNMVMASCYYQRTQVINYYYKLIITYMWRTNAELSIVGESEQFDELEYINIEIKLTSSACITVQGKC